ncbi:MAG: hypothetical protein AAFO75_10830 [Pseudomonadota bacterium]
MAIVLVAAGSLGLAGCSAGEVQLEGKVFDALGVNSATSRSETPKLASRSPLVVPPSLQRLPQPGEQVNNQDAVLATINDPDRNRAQSKAQLEAEQAKVCADTYEPAKARGDPDADLISGPLGPCRPSVLNAIGGVGSLFGN